MGQIIQIRKGYFISPFLEHPAIIFHQSAVVIYNG